jgi:hypothetical protein
MNLIKKIKLGRCKSSKKKAIKNSNNFSTANKAKQNLIKEIYKMNLKRIWKRLERINGWILFQGVQLFCHISTRF